MAQRPILTWPDARLGAVCDPVPSGQDLDALVGDMFDTMYAAPGRGLAAPQIGVLSRVFVTDTTWKQGERTPMVFVNPVIVARAPDLVCSAEGCLSIPGVMVDVTRPAWVDLEWTDETGTARHQRFDGFAAACVQHELDHLDGIVTFDRISADARRAAQERYESARA